MQTPLHPENEALRAAFAPFFGVDLPADYGAPDIEWRLARETVALFDTSYHAIFELTGPDRARYLNAITTGDIKTLPDGRGVLGLLLNAQGHILDEIETYAFPEKLLLLSHLTVRQPTFATLDKFIIMDDCTLADVSEQFASCALEGPRAAGAVVTACGVALDSLDEFSHVPAHIAGADCRLIRRSHFGFPGAEFIAPSEKIRDVWRALLGATKTQGGNSAGYTALNALRIEAGIPWFGYDFDQKTLPHEAGLEYSHISYTKGCYTGQEIVERVRSRGHVNRRLTLLQFFTENPPASGTPLLAGGKEVGHVTSAATSPVTRANLGFGYVRREHSALGSYLEFNGGTAAIIEPPARPAPSSL